MNKINLNNEDILNRISYIMNDKHISAYEMSLRLGHSTNYFYKIQSGRTKLTMLLFLDILRVLEISTSEFFYYDYKNYARDIKLLETINACSEEERNSIMTLLKIKK